jgi:hypothetical protein
MSELTRNSDLVEAGVDEFADSKSTIKPAAKKVKKTKKEEV